MKYVPVPLIVAELCLRGLIQITPEGLPNRMRVEHPNDFQAALLAAIMERDLFDKPEAAFKALVELSANATSEDAKESVCISLFETSVRCGAAQIDKAIEVVTRLRPGGSRFLGLLHAMKHLVDGNLPQAKEQLDAVRNESDGVWWQAHAQFCERSGDEAGAVHAWEKASELVPHPDVVRRSIKASIDRRRYQSAIRGLIQLLEEKPDNEEHLRTLVWALVQLGDHVQAATYLKRLVELNSSNRDYRMWLAQALARTARTAKAIEVLKPVCDAEDAPLEAILFLSELLVADTKPADAFQLLEAIAPDHWDDPRFLFSYMQRGYAAGNDRLAHEAFARILELRREGKIPMELLQEGTIEQILEHGRNFQSRREALQRALIAGRMTWLFAEDSLGNAPAWAWTLHTQELKWLSEEPLTRAAFSVYATNSFTGLSTPMGKLLHELTAPPAGTHVVADLTALLTLFKLDALERAAEHFDCIILPASYGLLHVRDADRFAQHQPSREQELLAIRKSIEQRRIRVESQWPESGIELDEYSDDRENHVYRLQDLLPLLKTTQKVTPAALAELSRVAHRPSAVDAVHPELQLGDTVLVSLMTLRQISNQAVFEEVISALSICIRATEYEELLSELRAHESARSARQLHDELWQTVTDLADRGKISWKPLPAPPEPSENPDTEEDDVLFLDSIRLAQHLRYPLLADDRVLQVLASHDETNGPLLACGSDCVVLGMQRCGTYDAVSAARDFHQLMKWRYRFLVPSSEILYAWAEESAENLPGPALLDAAFYLHDSLRDPGLHCGPEQSDPPMPMAIKYVTAWMNSTASFLAKVWSDGKFSEEACVVLTMWVGEELIPSCPRGLWYNQIGYNIAQRERLSVLSMAMVQFTSIHDRGRANRALRTLAEALGISEDQYLAEAANAIKVLMDKEDTLGVEPEGEMAFCNLMMQNTLFHLKEGRLDALAFSRFKALGLLEDATPPPLPEGLADMLREASQSTQNLGGPGGLVFIPEEESVSVIEVDSLLFRPEAELRRAALVYLIAAGESEYPWLTSHTLNILKDAYADIASMEEDRWRGAATTAAETVRIDLFGIQTCLRQCLAANYKEGINHYVGEVMNPSFETLVNYRPHVWHPSEQRQEIISWIQDLAKHPALDDALTGYLQRCGYVPLSNDLSAARLVTLWISAHQDNKVSWADVWKWAERQINPIARYHAVTVALHVPQVRPVDEWEQFWSEASNILNPDDTAKELPQTSARWRLSCELASHFAYHIEAIHPTQHGEAIACYAWWLAAKVGELLGKSERNAEWALREIVLPHWRSAYFRWTVARSPVIPSPMRYATLQLQSVWAMSLLTNLGLAAESLPQLPGIPNAVQQTIANMLHSYLVTSHLAQPWGDAEVPFAFQENEGLEFLCTVEGYGPHEVSEQLVGLLAFRKELSDPKQVASYLDRFSQLPPHVQHLLALALKDLVNSTTAYDETFAKWLEQTDDVVEFLASASEIVVDPLLEACAEFQQHQIANWSIRLPHLLTYAIEGLSDPERVRLLAMRVLQMSVNAGAGSAVQRLAESGRWTEWVSAVSTWRANMQEMAPHSEPWVAGRVRSISATVSRLIGPHFKNTDLEELSGVEGGVSEEKSE